MTYNPLGKFLWDFWIVETNGTYHLYHLQAPKDPDPMTRHQRAEVGHAVSEDLVDWEEVGTVLEPSADPEAWDSTAIWTGSVVQHKGQYVMFYTSRRKTEVSESGYEGHTERLGAAVSTDCYEWEKHDANPLLLPDQEKYESQDQAHNDRVLWRDPYVVADPSSKYYYAFITARDGSIEDPMARSCIARARSTDLIDWEILPPAASPGAFKKMEVPTLHRHDGTWFLLFSVRDNWYGDEYRREIAPEEPQSGVMYYTAESLDEEFTPPSPHPTLIGGETGEYAGRIVTGPTGEEVLLTWIQGASEGYDSLDDSYSIIAPQGLQFEGERLRVVDR